MFFGSHPDDIELTSGGLAALLASHGHRVVLVDLTRGEAASRGTLEERAREAEQAAAALGVAERSNLELPDLGLSRHDRAQMAAVVSCLRRHRPRLVVAPDRDDVHPDHIETHHLIVRACYLSGLARFPAAGERYRPARVLFALYRATSRPHLVVDVSPVWERRAAAIAAHQSQLDPARGPATYLTHPEFITEVEARARVWGSAIGARFGEGYRVRGPVPVSDARVLIGAEVER
ncbi:MAG TPA: bacillithiol biosynthesis deacetylase BshB1 [Candidatus Udaeobacter sp.]|nr:bacillithiol biosynthesis deacetylase BshB1 [Candidatus Udaeobacter sp.]